MLMTIFLFYNKAIVFHVNLIMIVLLLAIIAIALDIVFGSVCRQTFGQAQFIFGHQLSICRQQGDEQNFDKEKAFKKEKHMNLFIQVCATSDIGMKSVLGYGSLSIPIECGNYEFEIQTCKLIASKNIWNEIFYRMNDYYFGCTMKNVQDLKNYFMYPLGYTNDKKPLHMNNQIISESSGTVKISLQIISKSANNKHDINGIARGRHMLDEVLSKVRRHKRLLHKSTRGTSPLGKEDHLNPTTKELLSRVKARKEARKK